MPFGRVIRKVSVNTFQTVGCQFQTVVFGIGRVHTGQVFLVCCEHFGLPVYQLAGCIGQDTVYGFVTQRDQLA